MTNKATDSAHGKNDLNTNGELLKISDMPVSLQTQLRGDQIFKGLAPRRLSSAESLKLAQGNV